MPSEDLEAKILEFFRTKIYEPPLDPLLQLFLKIITCDPSVHAMGCPDFIALWKVPMVWKGLSTIISWSGPCKFSLSFQAFS